MTQSIGSSVLSSGSTASIEPDMISALERLDVFAGSSKTAGLILAAAAMGSAHARGEKVSNWPSLDAITSRSYWQRIAGWTDEQYSRAVVEARERAAHGHARIILEITKQTSSAAASKNREAITTGETVLAETVYTSFQNSVNTVRKRVDLVVDAESVGMYSSRKYKTMLTLAGPSDYIVYYCREDGKVRLNHKILHGKAWPVGSHVWRRILPPNGYKCRCVFKLKTLGWVVQNLGKEAVRTSVPLGGGPDTGFSNDPRSRKRDDWSKYRAAHVSALMRTSR